MGGGYILPHPPHGTGMHFDNFCCPADGEFLWWPTHISTLYRRSEAGIGHISMGKSIKIPRLLLKTKLIGKSEHEFIKA